jgi:hypothetical protein
MFVKNDEPHTLHVEEYNQVI